MAKNNENNIDDFELGFTEPEPSTPQPTKPVKKPKQTEQTNEPENSQSLEKSTESIIDELWSTPIDIQNTDEISLQEEFSNPENENFNAEEQTPEQSNYTETNSEFEEQTFDENLNLEEEITLEEDKKPEKQKKSKQQSKENFENSDLQEEPFASHTTNIKEYILHHKLKISLFVALVVVLNVFVFVSQVGIRTKTLPEFQNQNVKIVEVDYIKIKYGFGETMDFYNGKVEFNIDKNTKATLTGDFTIKGNVMTLITRNINHAFLEIKKGTLEIQNQQNSTFGVFNKLIDDNFSIFASIKAQELELKGTRNGTKFDSLTIKELTMENIPSHTKIEGTLSVNNYNTTLSYFHNKNPSAEKENLSIGLISSIFDFSLKGSKQEFGTINKEVKIVGDTELAIRNTNQFASLFTENPRISQYFTNLPKTMFQGQLEYNSSGGIIRVKNGKLNVFNSLANVEITTLEAERQYKATINFETLAFDELSNYFASFKEIFTSTNKSTNAFVQNQHINMFSVFGLNKVLLFEVNAERSLTKEAEIMKQVKISGQISENEINIQSFTANIGEETTLEANGGFYNISLVNPYGFFDVSLKGKAQNLPIFETAVQFLTRVKNIKPFEAQPTEISFSLLLKNPAYIFSNINVEIENYLNSTGTIQFSEKNSLNNQASAFYDVKIFNADFTKANAEILNFQQNETLLQRFINNTSMKIEKNMEFENAKINNTSIENAKFKTVSGGGTLFGEGNIKTDFYNLHFGMALNGLKATPALHGKVILQEVQNFATLRKDISSIFKNGHIFLPKADVFSGKARLIVTESKILGETVSLVDSSALVQNGIFAFTEAQFKGDAKMEGKISGRVLFNAHKPNFEISTSFINAKMETVQKILPIQANFGGTISGGGNFTFTGISAKDIFTSLKMNAKFVLKKIKIPKVNMDFLAQTLLKTHGKSIYSLDKLFIEQNIENNTQTLFNVLFKISGQSGKFTIEECDVKTAYTGAVCAGNLTILPNGHFTFEAISKFAIPALDINKNLGEIMKLFVSVKHEVNSSQQQCKVTKDLAQIYQYINYRRATFAM